MQIILSDHNCEGHAQQVIFALNRIELAVIAPVRLLLFSDPVLTIGDLNRVLHDRDYCERCAERLAEIVLDLVALRGVTRLYLP
jgi:hypothetical protein